MSNQGWNVLSFVFSCELREYDMILIVQYILTVQVLWQ